MAGVVPGQNGVARLLLHIFRAVVKSFAYSTVAVRIMPCCHCNVRSHARCAPNDHTDNGFAYSPTRSESLAVAAVTFAATALLTGAADAKVVLEQPQLKKVFQVRRKLQP